MESFALLRKHLAMGGIAISQKSSKNHPLNVRNSTVFILLCTTSTSVALSLNDAKAFEECIDILFRSVSIGTGAIFYGIVVWKTSELFEFINSLADTVRASEK